MTGAIMHTIPGVTLVSGLGRSTIYTLIAEGKLDARKAGSRTVITDASLRAYLASLPPAGPRRKAAA